MVELNEPKLKKDSKGKFVYDNADPKLANFVGIFNDAGKAVRKDTKGNPKKKLAANGKNGRVAFPDSDAKLMPHEILINGETKYWFDFIKADEIIIGESKDEAKEEPITTSRMNKRRY